MVADIKVGVLQIISTRASKLVQSSNSDAHYGKPEPHQYYCLQAIIFILEGPAFNQEHLHPHHLFWPVTLFITFHLQC